VLLKFSHGHLSRRVTLFVVNQFSTFLAPLERLTHWKAR
jgi:hypothetical protein